MALKSKIMGKLTMKTATYSMKKLVKLLLEDKTLPLLIYLAKFIESRTSKASGSNKKE